MKERAISIMNTNSGEISITQRLARAKVEDFIDAEAEAFADRMIETLNSAALALMISVGHRTELFDTLADLPPATSERIAKAAGLSERYVREWLGAMVTARIIDYDPSRKTYFLPREHAVFLMWMSDSFNTTSSITITSPRSANGSIALISGLQKRKEK